MLTKRIIPCLDIRAGRVVKGVRFANLRDAGDPVEQATRYEDEGADEITILDVSATTEARAASLETVADVRAALSIPLTVGGGVRTFDDALALLEAGADRVSVNTAAVDRPEFLRELADRVGTQCVVLAIDAARQQDSNGWEVVTRAGTNRTGIDAIDWANRAEALGVGEILLTSFDRDGTGKGYDTDLLRAVTSDLRIPVIASGGAKTARHMTSAFASGADAVLAATIFHDRAITVTQLKQQLASMNIEVRA